jgi:hypothetical protein
MFLESEFAGREMTITANEKTGFDCGEEGDTKAKLSLFDNPGLSFAVLDCQSSCL